MSFEDRNIDCIDCGATFVWTAGEQRFFDEKGFTNEPRRCPDCRARKKASRAEDESGGGPRGGGGGGGGGYRSGGGAPPERRARELNEFACSLCGTTAKLPFPMVGDDPVYCLDCYNGRTIVTRKPRRKSDAARGDDETGTEEATADVAVATAETPPGVDASAETSQDLAEPESGSAPAAEATPEAEEPKAEI